MNTIVEIRTYMPEGNVEGVPITRRDGTGHAWFSPDENEPIPIVGDSFYYPTLLELPYIVMHRLFYYDPNNEEHPVIRLFVLTPTEYQALAERR